MTGGSNMFAAGQVGEHGHELSLTCDKGWLDSLCTIRIGLRYSICLGNN